MNEVKRFLGQVKNFIEQEEEFVSSLRGLIEVNPLSKEDLKIIPTEDWLDYKRHMFLGYTEYWGGWPLMSLARVLIPRIVIGYVSAFIDALMEEDNSD